jgi:excisionase family DNA binding protein
MMVGEDGGVVAVAESAAEGLERIAFRVARNMPLTLREAAEFTGLPMDTLRRMVTDGRIERAVLCKGTGTRRRHFVLLPRELLEELRGPQRRQ